MNYIVYTEIFNDNGTVERWFYGKYSNADRANEVALALGNDYPIYHCVCEEHEAEGMGVENLPR